MRPNWGDHATYHAVVVASQYQQKLSVVVARSSIPGVSAEQIEADVAIPLEEAVRKLPGVKGIKSQASDAEFLMEVHFDRPAGSNELKEVQQVIDDIWGKGSNVRGRPFAMLGEASLL
jgi:hypothetical protein